MCLLHSNSFNKDSGSFTGQDVYKRQQQIGTPIDIYNEPINSFVADFIGESNILNGTMIHDKLVRFCGTEFECVDEGFGENTPVDVVIRPEDLYIFPVSEMAQLTGVVQTSIFKGVHLSLIHIFWQKTR